MTQHSFFGPFDGGTATQMMSVASVEHHNISVNPPNNNLSKDIEHTMNPIRMDNNQFPTEASLVEHNTSAKVSPRGGPKGIKVTIPGNEAGDTSLRLSTLQDRSSYQSPSKFVTA